MRLYLIMGQTPTLHRKKTAKAILASRRNGKVKVLNPATIRAINLKGATQ